LLNFLGTFAQGSPLSSTSPFHGPKPVLSVYVLTTPPSNNGMQLSCSLPLVLWKLQLSNNLNSKRVYHANYRFASVHAYACACIDSIVEYCKKSAGNSPLQNMPLHSPHQFQRCMMESSKVTIKLKQGTDWKEIWWHGQWVFTLFLAYEAAGFSATWNSKGEANLSQSVPLNLRNPQTSLASL
jgi:hypothetical protein